MATRYVVLLRGVNVGGNRKVPMADLREALDAAGYDDVRTYIQSGNVVLRTDEPRSTLERSIEGVLERRFGFPIVVVVRSHRQFRHVVEAAPDGFGRSPDRFHSDVIFLKAPLTAAAARRTFDPRDGVDEVWAGTGVLYTARVSEQRTKSRMNRIVGTPAYQSMTIRSWTTTTKLLALLDERD